MSITEELTKIQLILDQTKLDTIALEGGRKSSAVKVRLALMKIKNMAHQVRKLTTEHVKSIPVKKRETKITVDEPTPDSAEVPMQVEPVHAPEPAAPVAPVAPKKRSRRTKTMITPV